MLQAETALICMSGTQWAQPIQINQRGNLWKLNKQAHNLQLQLNQQHNKNSKR